MPSLATLLRVRRLLIVPSLVLLAAAFVAPRSARAVSVVVEWVAPGDDSTFGQATEYDLRYSWKPRFPSGFAEAVRWTVPAPGPAGTIERATITGLQEGKLYYFALKVRDDNGNWSNCSNIAAAIATLDAAGPRYRLNLSAAAPSPARTSTRISLTLPNRAFVRLDALDVSGRRVRSITKGELEAGPNEIEWDLRDDSGQPTAPGVYFLRAKVLGEELQRRLIVVR